MELSKRELRHIRNLAGVCEFDLEKRVATMPLHYDTAEDLLDEHLSRPGKPVISQETIDYIRETISFTPTSFSVEFALTIDECGEYECESLMNALRATFENTFYYHDESRKKDIVLAAAFLIVGALILALEVVGGMAGWYGAEGSVSSSIIITVLEVMTWVLIWEGAYIVFLTYANDSTIFAHDMRRLHGLRLLDASGEEQCTMTREQMYQGWVYLSGKEIFARNYILFSNVALLIVASIIGIELFAGVEDSANMPMFSFVIGFILTIVLVFSNISFYKESGKLKHWALPASIICLLYAIFDLIVEATAGFGLSMNVACDIVLCVVLLIDIICLWYMRRQNIVRND